MADDSQFELELKQGFLDEAEGMLAEAEQSFLELETKQDEETLEALCRLAHNLKGGGRAAGFDAFAEFTHELETVLAKMKKRELAVDAALIDLLLACHDRLRDRLKKLKADFKAPFSSEDLIEELRHVLKTGKARVVVREKEAGSDSETTIRLSLERIDNLVNDVGELVILNNALRQLLDEMTPAVRKGVDHWNRILKNIQQAALTLRMVPVRSVFQKMRRIARDVAAAVGKDVEVVTTGESTEMDKSVLEKLADPLMHCVHNAVDHGVAKKGMLTLSAYYRGDRIIVECSDDGRGLDPKKLVKKAVEKGLIPKDAALSDAQARDLIFLPGFSTAAEVTGISGRGVGMDVVKSNVTALGGKVEIESEVGKGTKFRFVLPLTLAIVDGMVVQAGEEQYIVPLAQIDEALRPSVKDVHSDGIDVRGRKVPFLILSRLLGEDEGVMPSEATLLVLKGDRPSGVVVDAILSQQQVVTKQLGNELQGLPGVTGGGILPDGRAALVMDLSEMVRYAGAAA